MKFTNWILAGWVCGIVLGGGVLAANLEWQKGVNYRSAPLELISSPKPGFFRTDPLSTGILFTNRLADERSVTNRNLLSGSGLAAGDIDGDGWVDLYFCGLDSANVLYRNLGGWKFEDITEAAGVACAGQDSTGATFADVDGDGDLDLLVTSLGGGVRLFLNDGTGRFTESTAAAGLSSRAGSMSLALADVDGDGDLDLYVANFRPTTFKDQPTTRFRVDYIQGRPEITQVNGRPATLPDLTNRFVLSPGGTVLELAEPDFLYLNDGNGKFTPVSFTGGTFLDEAGQVLRETPRDWGLAVQFHDFNGDGAPDIYVCNDLFTPDRIWMNDGAGRFRAIDPLALRNTSTFSMGVDFADIDRDGHIDFFVVDMLSQDRSARQVQLGEGDLMFFPPGLIENRPQFPRNTLQRNRGDNTFAEIAYYSGTEAAEWAWGPIFLDVDLDGYEDIIVSNGQLRDFQNADIARRIEEIKAAKRLSHPEMLKLFDLFPGLETRNVIFRNRGDLTFEETGKAWGFTTGGISQGMALADLDNDGDLDLIINNLKDAAGVYRNEGSAPRVAVRLRGAGKNTQGIGAKVALFGGAVPVQRQEIISGGRYLAGDDPMRVFAAGNATEGMAIEVVWRDGTRTRVENVQANRVYEVRQPAAPAPGTPGPGAVKSGETPGRPTLFEDVSGLIGHSHVETDFNDFERQILLPHRLSQLGPGVSWYDLNGDGWDDLIIGSGRGGRLGVYRNNGQGGFAPWNEPPFHMAVPRDTTSILGWQPRAGETALLVGSSNYEDGQPAGSMVRVYDLKTRSIQDRFPGQASSVGPMTMADIDGDGDLDLFVGGRVVPGRYPEAASSFLFRNENGNFKLDETHLGIFAHLGMVSGALFSDLDGDGFPDLILAMEWGPVRVFRNKGGIFEEATEALGLDQFPGWWTSVATGDFNGDGRLDILAGNWGLNTKYRASRERPRQLYYGDLGGFGRLDSVEAVSNPGLGKIVPERDLNVMAMAIPWLREKFETYEAYARAGMGEIFGDALANAGLLEASTLETMVFLNHGERFEARPLPPEAQFAPVFGLVVADFDGDGKEDVFLSQNHFATNPQNHRADAGRGLWLKGDGTGGFVAVAGQESGVRLYGEQRGAAAADFDRDGRVDLVVTQNGAATKLFRNRSGDPGLRVRLAGPAGNPAGVGAVVRLAGQNRFGAAREVQAGSGYWSQNSSVQVMHFPGAEELRVRWPGGKETRTALPAGLAEVTVNSSGEITARW